MLDEIRNAHGERIDFTFAPAAESGAPTVVIGHGVTANKDRPWALALADALEEAGFGSLRISFSGNGDSDGDFRDSTITKEVSDLGAVLDACERASLDATIYIGHSMGAAVGVLRASRDPRITKLISLGGMVHTAEFAARKFGALQPDRDVMWEKPECPLSSAFMTDMREIETVVELGAAITVPWLLVHGADDTVVPISDSTDIAAKAPNATLVEMPGADHVFTGDAARQCAEHVVAWLRS